MLPTTRRSTVRSFIMALALGLIVLVILALACGPASPAEQGGPTPTPTLMWLEGTPPSASELATLRAQPTATPYPPGYVRPTDLPTFTPIPPLPTLYAQMLPTEQALQTRQAQADATGTQNQRANSSDDVRRTEATTPESQLLDEIREFMAKGNFDAVARVRAGSHRDVLIPVRNGSQMLCRRQTLEVISTYQGTLPPGLDIITAPADRVNLHVDENREYIMFLSKIYVLEGTYPRDRFRREYTRSELDAFGGEAFFYNYLQLWVIDAQTAHRVPPVSVSGSEPIVSHLEAARNGGQRLSLSLMERELRDVASTTRLRLSETTGGGDVGTPTPAPEARVTALARDRSRYDAVARVRVRSHTEVAVPVKSIEWPEERLAVPSTYKYLRSNLEVLERYHGTLPAIFETVNPLFRSNPHLSLQVGQEYVVFVYKRWLPEDEHSEDERRIHYNREQLKAIGGEGYDFSTGNTWIVDGDNALLVPASHIRYADARDGSHLEAARRVGESVPLTTLENYIRRATGNSGNN